MNPQFLQKHFDAAVPYDDYLASDPEKAGPWREIEARVGLNDGQRSLVEAFSRDMKVLVSSGIWCGDCDLRWVDRDAHAELSEAIRINQGMRVPVAIFMAEDHEPVSVFGDRTLTRYRAMAAKQLGPACPVPGAPVPQDELEATLQDWLDEFERVHLLLRLSGRLRQKHGD